jgi:hypothetical protein
MLYKRVDIMPIDDHEIKRYEEDSDAIIKPFLEKERRTENFLIKLARSIFAASPTVDWGVAIICASTLISSCVPYVRIKTRLGPLALAEMNLIIGPSGSTKTLPLRIVRKTLDNLHLTLPERYTTEGIEERFSKREQIKTKEGEMLDTPYYVYEPFGAMVMDEVSQTFKETAKKEYLSGAIEQLSQFFDMQLKQTALARGVRSPLEPYISVLSATVPEFIPSLDDYFFQQGFAGRFHWYLIEPKASDTNIDIMDWRSFDKASKDLQFYDATLRRLLNSNVPDREDKDGNLDKDSRHEKNIKKRQIVGITLDSKANDIWKEYKKDIGKRYESKAMFAYASDIDFQYIARLPELVLRQSGIFSIGRCMDFIREKGNFNLVEIISTDMINAIELIETYDKHLQKIIKIKKTGDVYSMGVRKARTEVYTTENLVTCLLKAPNRMLNTKQLWDMSKIADNSTFTKYLYQSVNEGEIKIVNKEEIQREEEKKRLNIGPGKATKIWTVTDKVYLRK